MVGKVKCDRYAGKKFLDEAGSTWKAAEKTSESNEIWFHPELESVARGAGGFKILAISGNLSGSLSTCLLSGAVLGGWVNNDGCVLVTSADTVVLLIINNTYDVCDPESDNLFVSRGRGVGTNFLAFAVFSNYATVPYLEQLKKLWRQRSLETAGQSLHLLPRNQNALHRKVGDCAILTVDHRRWPHHLGLLDHRGLSKLQRVARLRWHGT